MKFDIGDKVTVRSWDDMIAQYGFNTRYNSITAPGAHYFFTPEMRQYCGKQLIVCGYDAMNGKYQLKDGNQQLGWGWCEFMFEDYLSSLSSDEEQERKLAELLFDNDDDISMEGAMHLASVILDAGYHK